MSAEDDRRTDAEEGERKSRGETDGRGGRAITGGSDDAGGYELSLMRGLRADGPGALYTPVAVAGRGLSRKSGVVAYPCLSRMFCSIGALVFPCAPRLLLLLAKLVCLSRLPLVLSAESCRLSLDGEGDGKGSVYLSGDRPSNEPRCRDGKFIFSVCRLVDVVIDDEGEGSGTFAAAIAVIVTEHYLVDRSGSLDVVVVVDCGMRCAG